MIRIIRSNCSVASPLLYVFMFLHRHWLFQGVKTNSQYFLALPGISEFCLCQTFACSCHFTIFALLIFENSHIHTDAQNLFFIVCITFTAFEFFRLNQKEKWKLFIQFFHIIDKYHLNIKLFIPISNDIVVLVYLLHISANKECGL